MKKLIFSPYLLFPSLCLIVWLLSWLCLGAGMGTWQNPSTLPQALLTLRLPRVEIALLVGLALAVSGASLQALFMNPLADPSLIGISGGSALGIVLVLFFGVGGVSLSLSAFVGGISVCLLILFIHKLFGGGITGLIIIGFIISSFCGAITSLIMFFSDNHTLRSAMIWLAGNLSEAGLVPIGYAVTGIVLGLVIILPLGRKLDILMLGEETAISMGINIPATRTLTIIATALLTGSAVSLSGVIGFIGMMIPNIIALLIGGSRTCIMLHSAWLGSVFLLLTDTIARTFAYPIDIPIGIIISLLGGPFFIWLFIYSVRKA